MQALIREALIPVSESSFPELQIKQEVLTSCAACRSLAWLRLSKHVQENP
jgi:hypothetical protein